MYALLLAPNVPLKTTPELSLTVTGAPLISLRKPEGSWAEGAPFSIVDGEGGRCEEEMGCCGRLDCDSDGKVDCNY